MTQCYRGPRILEKLSIVSVHFNILMLRSFDERIGRQGDLLPSRDGLIKKGQ